MAHAVALAKITRQLSLIVTEQPAARLPGNSFLGGVRPQLTTPAIGPGLTRAHHLRAQITAVELDTRQAPTVIIVAPDRHSHPLMQHQPLEFSACCRTARLANLRRINAVKAQFERRPTGKRLHPKRIAIRDERDNASEDPGCMGVVRCQKHNGQTQPEHHLPTMEQGDRVHVSHCRRSKPLNSQANRPLFRDIPKSMLLDSKASTSANPVTSKTSCSKIDLHDLRLDDARALLGHDASNHLPAAEDGATVYLQSIIDTLCELSLKDPLTGLANRRHFQNVLSREIDAVARSGESSLLLMLDVDHFKKVNDTFGHSAGDQVLQAIAKCLTACVRPMDTVARYGGEEFAAILPNCPASFGKIVAERIRESVAALSISVSPQVKVQITVSVGGAYAPEWVRSTTTLWTDRADMQLYRAKVDGRNRVYIDQQPELAVSAEEKSLLFGHLLIGDPAWIESVSSDAAANENGNAMNRVN